MKKAIVALLMLSLVAGCSAQTSSKPTVKEGTKATQAAGASTQAGETKPDGSTQAPVKPEIGKIMAFEKFELTINSIKKAKGYDNKAGVLVDYTFKNLDEKSTQPFLGSSLSVFQDGVQVQQGFYTSDNAEVSRRLQNAMTDVKKGVPISCLTFFETTSQSPLTLQIEPFFNFDKDQEIKFTTDFPKNSFKAADMSPPAKLGDGEPAIGDGVIDIKLGQVIELPTFDMVIHGIYQAKDYAGKSGILLDYTMKNKKEESFDPLWNTTVKLYQNGVELDNGMYTTDNSTLSAALRGKLRRVMPGATVQCLDFYETDGTKDIEININALWGSEEETIMLKTAFPKDKVNTKTLSARLKEERITLNKEIKAMLPQTEDRTQIGKTLEFDGFEIVLTEVRTAALDQGKKGLLVFYTFKNTVDENKMPGVQVAFKAYQDGVEIDTAYFLDNAQYKKVNGNSSKEVQPGATVECAEAFEYASGSIVVLEVYPTFTLDGTAKQVLAVNP